MIFDILKLLVLYDNVWSSKPDIDCNQPSYNMNDTKDYYLVLFQHQTKRSKATNRPLIVIVDIRSSS